ncbi:hypothetical protein OG772_20360 [Streptomyces sp. NBC_01321]|nr:hypothetical protein OG772_20360 [Streptomyces sp. NBC_01321]
MPDHGRVNRPEWQALWLQYEAVTTPLRAAGLVCDIETCGGETVIYVNLPDGTHLVIADDHSLPDRLADVTGWRIVRSHEDNPNFDGLLYDSTAEGEHAQLAAEVRSMLAAIALYLRDLRDADTVAAGQALGESLLEPRQCWCVINHPVTEQQRAELNEAITYARRIGDAAALPLLLARLTGPCPARA